MQNPDIIIIGGGLGGLTAGARLAKAGRKVLLFEQHSVPGGCATTFRRQGFLVEAGLHELDGLDATDLKTTIFRELDVFDKIQFVRLPEFYRVVTSTTDLVVPDDSAAAIEVFVKAFPAEEKGIRTFFKTIHALRDEVDRLPLNRNIMKLLYPVFPMLFPKLALHNQRTLGEFIDGIITDEELKLALVANYPYYHDDPYTLSLLYFSLAQSSYYRGGGHFIKGGSQRLSNHLADFIVEHGGEVMLNSKVTRIVVENGRAVGVAVRRRQDAEEAVFRAGTIVANAAVPLVVEMLPEPERGLLARRVAGMKPGIAWLSAYIGFRRDISSLNNRAYSTFFMGDGQASLKERALSNRSGFDQRGFAFVDYSRIDSGLGAEGKSFGVITTVDYIEDWEGLDEEAYRRKKDEVARMLVRRLEGFMPGISREIEYLELGTARTVRRFTGNPGGVATGYANVPGQSGTGRLGHRSPVPGLYFASAWAAPGGGFTGAILGGWMSAGEILSTKSGDMT
ncbi:MAG: NAD(P)/FAD-dependent oxidoreductase [Chlorobiaceae bacterium]|nr:NAD(P)/FAD-dependent oxidoreductase [Chlorobiaceae bacterium]